MFRNNSFYMVYLHPLYFFHECSNFSMLSIYHNRYFPFILIKISRKSLRTPLVTPLHSCILQGIFWKKYTNEKRRKKWCYQMRTNLWKIDVCHCDSHNKSTVIYRKFLSKAAMNFFTVYEEYEDFFFVLFFILSRVEFVR